MTSPTGSNPTAPVSEASGSQAATEPTDAGHFHTIVTTVENKPGVLARVAGLFARRGFNIESLAVAPTADERFSRITFTVDVASSPLEQVVRQLDKLINVVEIHELNPTDAVERELMLVVVSAEAKSRHRLLDLIDDFRAYVLDESRSEMMLSLAARPSRLDQFEELLRPYGIVKLQRTGRVALHRLDVD